MPKHAMHDMQEPGFILGIKKSKALKTKKENYIIKKGHTKVVYECTDCLVGFKNKVALDSHTCVLKYDPAMEVEVGFDPELKRPFDIVLSQTGKNAYRCQECGKVYKTLRGCNVHISLVHPATMGISDSTVDPLEGPSTVKKSRRSKKKIPKIKDLIPSSTSDLVVKSLPLELDVKPNPKLLMKKTKQYVCSRCPQICSSLSEYRKHVKGHPEYSTDSEVVLSTPSNVLTTNIISRLHECPNCLQKFRKIGSYRRHLRSHLNIHAYKCRHCLISYLTKSQLVSHFKQIHRGEKLYSCSLCIPPKKFYHSIGLRKHKSEHLSTPPYQCFRCDAVFPSIAKQVLHITNHAVSCSFCRKPFANEEELWLHASAEHEEEKEGADFLSDVSDGEDSDSNDESNANFNEVEVESDADSYTSVESDIEETSPRKVSVYSPFKATRQVKYHVCFICERRFPKEHSLDVHMKSHKIHSCMACPKFFAHPSELKSHQQEHLQNNSFFYSKAFNDLQQQQQHSFPLLTVAPFPESKLQASPKKSVMFSEPASKLHAAPKDAFLFSEPASQILSASRDAFLFPEPASQPHSVLEDSVSEPASQFHSVPGDLVSLSEPMNGSMSGMYSTDYIECFAEIQKDAEKLAFPMSPDLNATISNMVNSIASDLYHQVTMPQGMRDNFIKIHNKLNDLLARNAEYLRSPYRFKR